MPILNSQFTPDTTIILLKGVECDAMNNTYWGCFSTTEEQYNFYMNNFENQKITYDNYTYQRANGVVLVDGAFDDLRTYNYMMYRNKKTGNGSKWIYCFITSIAYVSDNVTSIQFETDVMQTWRFEIEKDILPSFVAYEHRELWYYNEAGTRLPCINTQPENIEIGDNLVCRRNANIESAQADVSYIIITISQHFDEADSATLEQGVPTQLFHYIFPFDATTGEGISSQFKVLKQGIGEYSITPFGTIYDLIRNDENFVNKCSSIIVTNALYGLRTEYAGTYKRVIANQGYNVVQEGDYTFLRPSSLPLNSVYYNDTAGSVEREYTNPFDILLNLNFLKETKLMFSPFSFSVLSNMNGTSKVYHHELFDDLTNIRFLIVGSIDTSKVDYIPENYKVKKQDLYANNTLNGMNDAFEDGYELSLPIVSDYTAVLMQTSKNSMNVGVSNTIRTNETSMRIASATGQAMSQQTGIQNSMRTQMTANNNMLNSQLTGIQNQVANVGMWSGLAGSLGSAAGNVLTGNLGGAIGSLIGGFANVSNTAAQMQANNLTMQAQNANAMNNASLQNNANSQITAVQNALRNTTTKYQAETNIQNAIESYQAKIHDANATADSIVSGGSNIYRVISLGLQTPILFIYTPTDEYIERASQVFNVRGYSTNLTKMPNLHTRQYWNYIQTVKVNIKGGDIDPQDLEKIKRCLDNGVTLWHTKDICDYTKENRPLNDPHNNDKFGNRKGDI